MTTHEDTVVECRPSDLDRLEQFWYRISIRLGVKCCARSGDLRRGKIWDGGCRLVCWRLHFEGVCKETPSVSSILYIPTGAQVVSQDVAISLDYSALSEIQ
jgi:hypothetical protein